VQRPNTAQNLTVGTNCTITNSSPYGAQLNRGDGNDTITGGAGDDTLIGGARTRSAPTSRTSKARTTRTC
jgi:Ca2+-binding RTX toxin-like protein